MATHDYVISNQSFPSTRTDLNNVLQAIVTNNSNATAPSTTFASMLWYDTANDKFFVRNSDNDAWIELFKLDETGDHLATIGDTITLDGAGQVGIGEATPAGQLHIKGSDVTNQVIIENTDAGSDVAPDLTLRRTSASPADGDGIGEVIFQSLNDNSENLTMADIRGFVTDVSDGTEDGAIAFRTRLAGSLGERMRVEGGDVGIGATPNTYSGFTTVTIGGSGASDLDFEHNGTVICSLFTETSDFNISATNDLVLQTGGSNDRVRLKDDGKLLVAKASSNTATAGIELRENGQIVATLDGGGAAVLNRLSSAGNIIKFLQDGGTAGQINTYLSGSNEFIAIGLLDAALIFDPYGNAIQPWRVDTNASNDNLLDLGTSSNRFDDIFATNGTIQTSDQNEKQQIHSLTDAEITAAKAISKLFKTFKFNDSVEAKGDNARIHAGHIAQEVQSAMTDAGLDATKYAFFCSDTWWETQTEVPAVEAVEAVTETHTSDDGTEVLSVIEEAVEAQDAYIRTDIYKTAEEAPEGATQRTRLGIRYPQLLAFIGAATEQRLTSIEARLTALEG